MVFFFFFFFFSNQNSPIEIQTLNVNKNISKFSKSGYDLYFFLLQWGWVPNSYIEWSLNIELKLKYKNLCTNLTSKDIYLLKKKKKKVIKASIYWRGCPPRSVMVKVMDCRIVVSEFILQLHYCVHFWTNALGKDMNPLILPVMD